jgi:nicotinamidase-related amidase
MQIAVNTALLIIDVQKAIDDPVWSKEGSRNNLDAERNIARLLERWRKCSRPIFSYPARLDKADFALPHGPTGERV